MDMWREITGSDGYHPGVKGSRLKDTLRICHKLIAGSIHGRMKSPDSITQPDMLALYCMHMDWKDNPGYFFLNHVKTLEVREKGDSRTGYIMVASFVSHLAEYWGCPDGKDAGTLAPSSIGPITLVNMKMIVRMENHYVKTLGATMDEILGVELAFQVPPPEFQQQAAPYTY
ncbi:hypothetical protein Fmac_033056 [Flemingia macrophylla]|uniref:Uncharacterized protein n=1 Tax=Flemingia macrophylla TaxID=520843 RepID=A0ABD1L6N6_9FABA